MKRYEYKKVFAILGATKKLNRLGYEGWELVSVDSGTMYFRREYDD